MQAYPLQWPQEQPRGLQQGKPFRSDGRWITINRALNRLFDQLRLMGVDDDDVVVSTNLKVRRSDGLPKSSQATPADTGVAVYFPRDGQDICIACDHCRGVEQNIAAIASVIKDMRGVERYGGKAMLDKAFTGFSALPSPAMVSDAPWRDVLRVGNAENRLEMVTEMYKRLRSKHHPDNGGDPFEFTKINRAYKAARQELGSA